MALNLDGKEWPLPPEQEARFQNEGRKKLLLYRSNYIKSAFVEEGHIQTRNLGPKHFAGRERHRRFGERSARPDIRRHRREESASLLL